MDRRAPEPAVPSVRSSELLGYPADARVLIVNCGWRVRRTDYEFLTSREARELVHQEGIVVIDYKAVQQTWSQTGRASVGR
jgi:hypothetical protein